MTEVEGSMKSYRRRLAAFPRVRRNLMRQIESDVERDEDKNRTPAEIIQDVLTCIKDRTEESVTRVDKLNSLVRLIKNHERLKYTYPANPFLHGLRFCVSDSVKEVRIAGYRALRYLIADAGTLEQIINLHYDIFIMRSLAKDPKSFNDEREQVLKLLRTFSDVPDGTKFIPLGVMRSIVSIAEQSDEKLRNMCIETLAEIMIRNPKIVTSCGGMRVLLQSLIDGPVELSEYLIMALLYVIDTPDSRECIRPGVDLEIVLSGFTDACNKGTKSDQHIKASSRAISVLLKSWTGIIFLCRDNKQAIKSIVESLRITSDETREIMLDMFFNIFRIKIPKWYPSFLSGKRITVYGNPEQKDNNSGDPPPLSTSDNDRLNLLDHHLVILLDIFMGSGLLDALVEIIEDKNQHVARKATLFIGEILQLSNRLLSVSRSIRIQSLPRLFSLATKFDDEIVRHSATAALSHIDNLNRTRNRLQVNNTDNDSTSIDVPRRNARQVESVKIKMGMQIDDRHFTNMLLESQVLQTKDGTKWNFETMMELLQGPLLNPRRLEESIKSKFIKRLIGFFRPTSRRFSEIEKTPENEHFVQLGCTLISTLLACSDGIKYLEGNKFLRQIAEYLNQLDPINGTPESEPLFSKDRINSTLTSGYFTILGNFSKYKEGIRLLEKFKIFNTFYRLTELRSREDLIKAIITNLDYSLDGHPRILLSKVMTSGYKRVRLYATKHLGQILRTSSKKFNEWGIQLLITQLYDPAMEVCQMAVRVLEETCNHKENIESLVMLRPSLDHLGEVGNPLLLRFLSTSIGFKYLSEFDYVEKEMDDWFQSRNQYYVTQLEVMLAKTLRLDGDDNRFEDDDKMPFDGISPPHFYGELAKTNEGCQLLREKGHFREFANFVREHKSESRDKASIAKLKSILWAIGNIGSSKSGLQFLEEEDIIKDIVHIAEQSAVLSLKGTCYFGLGLIAKTASGIEMLEELGWECVYDTYTGIGTGLCIPVDSQAFLSFPRWTYTGFESALDIPSKPIVPSTQVERSLLKAMANLTNRILSSTGSRNLSKIRSQHPEVFTNLSTYYKVIQMLSTYHYRLPSRRLISELFNVNFTSEALEDLDKLVEAQQHDELNGISDSNSTEDGNAEDAKQREKKFRRTHRGSDGVIAVMSEDQHDINTEEIVPKQALSPVTVIKGFRV
ncbi:Rapamycin-insensitive companion of mTOR, N-term-domain-containing protein [Glomus cerebriforme]|uniref:Rapamycin-insensitive companion of mTOR, N-term-domain-containing protein n=1 Tax=Glomus cerebriforme TaxID=658196 RepID=A0A397T8G8_9GLOM|nr:Rapamycin-insensitive companion of mTOR, N-term-domain-containing protein [Glomus cerebriforme]